MAAIADTAVVSPLVRILREPLWHFLLLGAVLFGLFAWFGPQGSSSAEAASERIVITAGLLENLRLSFERSTGRAPNEQELENAVDEYIREEILTREAIALGFHEEDTIVRRQLRRRMEFLHSDDVDVTPPSDADLQKFLEEHPERFRRRGEETTPELSAVRPAVERAWHEARRQQALDAAYEKLRPRYEVIRESPTATP